MQNIVLLLKGLVYIEHLFHFANGVSVQQYINKRRMVLAAKDIAEHPEEGILDISIQYGYSSNEAFARDLKSVWNCLPSEFR